MYNELTRIVWNGIEDLIGVSQLFRVIQVRLIVPSMYEINRI